MNKKQTGQPAPIKFSHTNLLSAQDGSIVSSRRQFKVSKEKFNGVSWVNASSQEPGKPGSRPTMSVQRRRAPRRTAIPAPVTATSTEIATHLPREGEVVGLPAPGIKKAYKALSEYYGHATIHKGLAPWTTIKFPVQLPDRYKELLWTTFAEAPPRQHQFDKYGILTHNPCIGNEGYVWTLNDPTRIQYCATMGVIFQCMNRGNLNAPDMAALVGRLCTHINNKLQNWSSDFIFYNDTISSITVLATLAVYKREFSQWTGHMKAVTHIVQNNGGSPTLLPTVKGAIAQVDLAGSLSTEVDPFMPLLRNPTRPQLVLKPEMVDDIFHVLQTTLSACRFDSTSTANIIDVAIFSANWTAARRLRSPVFNPDALIDEFLYLQHALILEPQSVWLPPTTRSTSTASSPPSHHHHHQQQQQQQDSQTSSPFNMPDALLTESLHKALRLAILLFIREPAIDPVLDASAYAPPLRHLYSHLRTLHAGILERKHHQPVDKSSSSSSSFSPSSARPLIIWICLLADTIRSSNNVRVPLSPPPHPPPPPPPSSYSSSSPNHHHHHHHHSYFSSPSPSPSLSPLPPPPPSLSSSAHYSRNPNSSDRPIPGDASHILRDLVREVLGLDDEGDSSTILLRKRDRDILGRVLDLRALRGDSWDWGIALGRLVVSSDSDWGWGKEGRGGGGGGGVSGAVGIGGCGTGAKARRVALGGVEGGGVVVRGEEGEEDTDVGWLCTIP